ncbi:MAG: glycosyltransferase [Bacteroidales bacterium]|nr:glycosyltransferase [Bacteroidales bacterium]
MQGGHKVLNTLKKDRKHSPLISIITVVYNSEAYIEKTIQSIINQAYTHTEYIIIDGGSTDKTIEIIKKYNKYINYWKSEKDKGIYDAMNKAMKIATGDYLWFINSGDEIYSLSILNNIFRSGYRLVDVFYGETEIIDYKGQTLGKRRHEAPENLNWKSLKYGMKVCHQSVIIRKKIAEPFDLKYLYSADFDWLIKILKKSRSIVNTKLVLSKFMDGGRTKKTIIPGLKERFRIMVKYYGLISTILNHFIIAYKFLFFIVKNKRF